MAIKPLYDEANMLARIAKGDERAFTEVFHCYYAALGEAIIKITESQSLTQEIVQDTFVKIWLNRAKLIHVTNFSNYLFIICRNHAFAAVKKLAKEKLIQPGLIQHLQWEAEITNLENPAEIYRELIEKAVANLPVGQQNIYKLSRYDRLKYEEIAEKLNLSPETVKTQVYNAVKSIRRELLLQTSGGLALVLIYSLTTS